jgi:DNA-binding IclR family transcriptional regulator
MALPAHRTSVGKALLVDTDLDLVEATTMGHLRALTAASVRDPALLRRELRRVRQRGVATDPVPTAAPNAASMRGESRW